MLLYSIASKVESAAFYDGYYLAMGFAGGPCKPYFCPKTECTALIPGKGCRNAFKSRESMEGAGMDAYAMAANAGWEIHPLGNKSKACDIPYGHRLGLVLIA